MLTSLLLASMVTNAAGLAAHLVTTWNEDDEFTIHARLSQVLRCEMKNLFITFHDDTGYAFAVGKDSPATSALSPGDDLLISGRYPAGKTPYFNQISILRHGASPTPSEVRLSDLAAGKFDWQLVRVSGIVREVLPSETNVNWVFLVIVDDGALLYIAVPMNGVRLADFQSLLGRRVCATGCNNPFDGSIRAYRGRIFHCTGLSAIRPLDNATSDPFAVPSFDTLRLRRPAEIATCPRVRATGRVIAAWGDRHFLLRTPSGETLRILCEQADLPTPGKSIETSGFPLSDFFHLTLSHALWREIAPVAVIEEPHRTVTAADVLEEKSDEATPKRILDGCSVTLHALVRDLPDADIRRGVMLVQSGAFIVPIDVSAAHGALNGVRTGCTVAVTGTCLLETENWRPDHIFPQIKGFRIIVNDPNGIAILSHPPWWTTGRLMSVIGVLLAVLVGIFIWNAALRRTATRKGRELLHEQLGHIKANLKTEERTRLAVELHDTLAQNLTGVSMEIEAANGLRGNAPPEMLSHIDIAAKALKSCRDELRNCLWDLRSQALEEPDMSTAVLRTLQPHVSDSRVSVRFNVPRSKISDNTAHALLRVIRELVINAIRHGNATEIKVAGSLDAEALRCSVTDNGSGFNPETAPGVLQGHFGLQGVRERIEELGGTIDLESTPGKGVRATIAITIPQEA